MSLLKIAVGLGASSLLIFVFVLGMTYAATLTMSQELPSLTWFRSAVDAGTAAGRESSIRAPCDAGSTLTVSNGVATASALLDQMTGFARLAGTNGGLGHRVFMVSSLEDRREPGGHGPAGSLREALWNAKQESGGWITFSSDLPGERRIDLEFALFVPSNTTIDGGCHGLSLTTPSSSVLVVDNVQNVVLTRLRLEQRGPVLKGRGDCVSGSYADRVWIAFNFLQRCEDGLVDFGMRNYSLDKPARVTVAFNHFRDHEKDMLLATYDCAVAPKSANCTDQWKAPWTWQGGVQATLQGNLFDGTSQRHPRLAGMAYAHLIDNVIAFASVERRPGEFGAAYGSFAGAGSRLFAQNNLYIPLGHRGNRVQAIMATDGQSGTRLDGNLIMGDATVDETEPQSVPPSPYELHPVADWKDPARGIACAAAKVGPEGLGGGASAVCH